MIDFPEIRWLCCNQCGLELGSAKELADHKRSVHPIRFMTLPDVVLTPSHGSHSISYSVLDSFFSRTIETNPIDKKQQKDVLKALKISYHRFRLPWYDRTNPFKNSPSELRVGKLRNCHRNLKIRSWCAGISMMIALDILEVM